ncbi:MAG: acyl-CoA dehydrogenase, partial [Deltaproteobacteria bacterium]|nr:acyl-CoA dehydrogenase [Deltaproteobacteria bacterium]
KPRGSDEVGLFVMPLWAPGAAGERRNGLTIDRLKWKMGTSELPTAEMTLDGAIAWQVGPLDRGLANVVGIVLTLSRLTVGLASAAFMTRAVREAALYARFRDVFGRKIAEFPMAQAQIEDMARAARRTVAGAFEAYRLFREAGGLAATHDPSPAARRRRFLARELVMLQKFVAAEDCTSVVREAIGIFGGNGAIEDFSCLPRLFRDSMVNELWEGPRNVLQAQIHRDLRKAAEWYPPGDLVSDLLAGAAADVVRPLADEVAGVVAHPSLAAPGDATVEACRHWDAALRAAAHAWQDAALARVARAY